MEPKPEECTCCQFKTDNLTFYELQNGQYWFCELCSSTMAGTHCDIALGHDVNLYRTICYVGNVIIEEIRKHHRKEPHDAPPL